MLSKVLVPLEGSDIDEVILAYATKVAGMMDLDVLLLHLYAPEEHRSIPLRRAYLSNAAKTIRKNLEAVRNEAGSEVSAKSVDVQSEMIEGYAAEEILSYASENDVDMILMCSHGRSGIRDLEWSFGSVTDKVLRRSKVPVWIIRIGISEQSLYLNWPNRKMLVPLDGSELAEKVLPYVRTLAKQWGAEFVDVTLLIVCDPSLLPSNYEFVWPVKLDDHMKRCRQVDEKYLAKIEKQLEKAGITVRSEVLVGKPADEIVDYANKNGFDLVVMATHGRSGISRWAYGSVADKVIRRVAHQFFLVRPT
jgi:nucleotide-binding universal stress UspA family protein